jgi:hypothetical protein
MHRSKSSHSGPERLDPGRGPAGLSAPIISVHVPKTAGRSFLTFLESRLGGRQIVHDWLGGPGIEGGATTAQALAQMARDQIDRLRLSRRRSGVVGVHGHFRASKYAFLDGPMFAWVRDPVERVVSAYHYCRRHGDPRNRLTMAVRRGLPLLDFAASDGMRNLQTRYLDVPLARFALVGRTERFSEDLGRVCRLLGLAHEPVPVQNANPDRRQARYDLAPEVRDRIAALNEDDAHLYKRVCEFFHDGRTT